MLNVEAENYICDDAKSYLSFKTFKYSDPDREMFNEHNDIPTSTLLQFKYHYEKFHRAWKKRFLSRTGMMIL